MKRISAWITSQMREMLQCLAAALLLDLCFREVGLLGLIPTAGPKNALPLLLGLVYGPTAATGGIGILLSGLLRGELSAVVLWEAACWVLVSVGMWRLWYAPGLACIPSLKTPRVLLQYLAFVLVSSALLGALLALLPGARFGLPFSNALLQVAGSAVAWSLLLGMPTQITTLSAFAVQPYFPEDFVSRSGAVLDPDLHMELTPDQGVLGLGDAVEAFNETNDIAPKQAYALLSCTEELAVAVLEHLPPGAKLVLELRVWDSVSIHLRYGGERFNPLAVHMVKDDPLANMDILGILMVREMATAASYRRRSGINSVKIVI